MRDFYDALRAAGASARNMLEHAAAGKWGVPEEECQGQNHFVVHTKTGRKLSYGELVPLASASTAPTQNAIRFKQARAVPLYRQGHPDRRSGADHERQGGIRDRRQECRAWCMRQSSGRRCIGSTLKSCDDAAAQTGQGRPAGGHARTREAALRIQAAGRRGGDREQQLGGAPGPTRS